MSYSPPPPAPQPAAPIDPARLARNWRAVTVELDAPTATRTERLLRRIGLPSHVTRLMAATPALRRSWYVSIAVMLLIGLGPLDTADPRASAFLMLLLTPLVPVVGVGLAYGSPSDPTYEVHLATPMSGLRLVLIRALAVMAVATPVIMFVTLLSRVMRPWAAAWFLPAIAVSAVSLALMTFTSPRRATGSVAIAWIAINLIARWATDDVLAAFVPVAQGIAAAVALIAAVVIAARRSTFDRLALS